MCMCVCTHTHMQMIECKGTSTQTSITEPSPPQHTQHSTTTHKKYVTHLFDKCKVLMCNIFTE